jgi:hypothetical protein
MRTEVKYILELIRDKTITIDNGTDRILNLFGVSVNEVDDVRGSLLKSLHQDLVGFQQMGFLTPDVKSGLGIAIEQVERYMRGELDARQQ